MDSILVNWETLDSLVLNFAKSENLLINQDSSTTTSSSSPPSSPSSSSYRSRFLIRQIRRSLEIGQVDTAIDLLREHAPFVLDDHRLLFRLQKQKFIELLRRGTVEDRSSAMECLRTALAPCAMDAYPEAYEEFKHVLLALIYGKDDQTSPVANEWAVIRRFEIAGLLSSVLRAYLSAYDPIFSMTLRYLISIHKGFCLRQGISSPISDLTERLLLEERDPPPVPQESLYEAPPFDEVDIQALAHAVELTRQGAVDSLRFSKGNLFQAFQNEICRTKLNVELLDELVHEYCVYRGLVEGGITSSFSGILSGQQIPSGSSANHEQGLGYVSSKVSNSDFIDDSSKETNAEAMVIDSTELRFINEVTSNQEDCSTSETSHPEHSRGFQRSRSHGIGERSRRKRWRGRVEKVEDIPDVSFTETETKTNTHDLPASSQVADSNILEEQQIAVKHSGVEIITSKEDDKYEFVLEMKELASKGMASEVVEEVDATDPSFFVLNPHLLFQLKQLEFLKLVKCGDHSGSLRIACSYLGPLAASNPTLLKPLKETLLVLLKPNEDALDKGIPFSVLASSLQVAMGRRLGVDEPLLMKLMRATLHTHNEWFRLQMCKDRFEGLLKIDSLKEIKTPLIIDDVSKKSTDNSTPGSSQMTTSSSNRMVEDGNSPTQVSSGDVICDETAILKVMEFLALPRADAIHLLAQYNGNAETVIQQIFA
ncbi:hypothetical protein GIB67_023449 [Kingdonia uniflora]|uniref:CTLH domain-containing protein n=1 Tax=Kingdonia uniflora TaxID=39325 RepID=A0A7J7PAE8_9MAGN|nr:hypothetical protein GIB67_023449 [Kingdonia uniflora]